MLEVRFGLEQTHLEERGCLENQMPRAENGVIRFTLSIALVEFWLKHMKRYNRPLVFVIRLRGREVDGKSNQD